MRIAHDRTVRGRRLAREEANSASGGEGNFVIATECRLSPDSGPSRGDPCRPAIRPSATYAAAICYVRFTSILLKNPLFWRQHLGFVALSARQIPGSSPHVAKMGVGIGMSFASFRRFWAVAASRNSSLAPLAHASAIDPAGGCASDERRASRPSFVRDMRRRRPRSWRSHGPCHERLHERSARFCVPGRLGSTWA